MIWVVWFDSQLSLQPVDWSNAEDSLEVDRKVTEVDWAVPGSTAGLNMLESFCHERLKYFGSDRNNPNKNALSNLSPWIKFGNMFHIGNLRFYCPDELLKFSCQQSKNYSTISNTLCVPLVICNIIFNVIKMIFMVHVTGQCFFLVGQISVQRCILTVRQYRSKYKESVESYIEEAIIRRELSDNFCFYNKNYDSIDGNLSTHQGLELIECVTCNKMFDGRLT